MENKMITISKALEGRPRLYRMCNPENENFQRIVFPFYDDIFNSSTNNAPHEILYILTGETTDAILIKEEEKDIPCLLPIPDEIFH